MTKEDIILCIIMIMVGCIFGNSMYTTIKINRFIDTFDQRMIVNQDLISEAINNEFNNIKTRRFDIMINPNCEMEVNYERLY